MNTDIEQYLLSRLETLANEFSAMTGGINISNLDEDVLPDHCDSRFHAHFDVEV